MKKQSVVEKRTIAYEMPESGALIEFPKPAIENQSMSIAGIKIP